MGDFSGILLSVVGVSIILLPVALVLILATLVANLVLGFCKPITEPINGVMETIYGLLSKPLDKIPSFPKIKRYFGSTKNILFICFVIIFLLFHYRSWGDVDVALNNISLLFPGTGFDLVTSILMAGGDFDFSSFRVNPEDFLQTIIFSLITGLFLHMGCTTKEPDAKVHFLVKLIYTMLITLFSSVVLGKIPSDMLAITFPDFSLEIGTVTGNSDAMMLLATLQQWGGALLNKFISIIPVIVAGYFLCQSISGFAAAFLGGFIALFSLSTVCPEALINPDSYGAAFLLLTAISLGELVALFFGEIINKPVEHLVSMADKVFEYYNIVSILISYFFYPTLVLPLKTYTSFPANGFNFASLLICIACLAVFALVTFAGYKIKQWVWKREGTKDLAKYAVAMVINIPLWIVYYLLFKV